jgi:hypothetical protein
MRARRKIVPVLLFSAAPLAACVQSQPHGPDLVSLRSELVETAQATALTEMPHFRPLCDDQGYPLVGNVAAKVVGYQPSEFCAEVRKQPL